MKGIIVVAILLIALGVAVYSLVRHFRRELAKLKALILKGQQYHEALAEKAVSHHPFLHLSSWDSRPGSH